MTITPLKLDWRSRTECFPFEDDDFYYITVESEHETPGNDKEGRLFEAKRDGVFKLLRFYGKDTDDAVAAVDLFELSNVVDYFVSYRPCVRMKVLVSVPKTDLNSFSDDPTACEINKPAEGYLSAFIPTGNATQLIESVADGMLSLVPFLYRSNKFISNVNIVREINRLRAAGRTIQRYIDLNQIPSVNIEDPECFQPNEVNLNLEIAFSFEYQSLYAVVDKDQYTIGYDCLLENVNLNHNTTINFLINLQQMFIDLQLSNTSEFDTFSFFQKYVIPTPILETKQNQLDGINKYEEDGQLNVLANLAKLITLDLDINLCKTAEEKAAEDRTLLNQQTINDIDRARKQTKDAVGNDTLSAGGVERLRERLNNIGEDTADGSALKVLYEEILAKVDLACVLEESIQCVLENMVTRFGQEVFDDPDLEKVFRIQNVSLGGLNDNCALNSQEKCDGTPDLSLKVGLPVFQGISIPENLPTLDFLADTIDIALQNLYNRLVNTLATTILGIFESTCDLILSFPDGIAGIPGQFKEWLSETLGVDLEILQDPEGFVNALRSGSGKGFVGIIGKAASRIEGAVLDVYTETGISLNLPNKDGQVEEVFVSPEFVANYISKASSAIEEVETVLTPSETQSLFKGNARPEVIQLAYRCATRNGKEIFPTQQDFEDAMSELGNLVGPNFLTEDLQDLKTVASTYCELADDTSSNALRNYFLSSKDSDLSSEEIDEIIAKEKQRDKTKILESLDTLEQFRLGALGPSFPNIFGAGGLIPETPPVIDEINQLVAREGLQSVVNNFNTEVSRYESTYSDIWNTLFVENSPMNIFSDILVDANFGRYQLGYDPASLSTIPTTEYSVVTLGPYAFGSDIDITGIAKEGSTINPFGGEAGDDALFEQLVKDLEPYVVSSTHTFENKMFKSPFARTRTGGWPDNSGDKVGLLQPTQGGSSLSISGARAYAYLLMKEMDTYQEDRSVDIPSTNPYWDEVFNGQDNQLFDLTVSYDDGNVTVDVKTYLGEEPEAIVRDSGWNTRIVEVEVGDGSETNPLSLKQTSEDYYVSSNANFLGRQVSTGRLNTQEYEYFNLSIGQVTDAKPISTYSRSNTQVIDDIYNATGGSFTDISSGTTTTAHDIIKDILEDFATYIVEGKYSTENSLDNLSLLYPSNDILDFSGLISFSQVFASQILSDTLSGNYCDALGPTRRANSIFSIKMLIRLFIVERAMIAIQATNGFDIDFMQSDLFISSIYKRLKTEVQKYKSTFDTIPGNLFPDMRDTATKYYEILKLDDEDIEIPETGKDAFTQLIVEEIQNLRQPIIDNLKLTWDSSTWDGFLIKIIFGEIDELDELRSNRGTIVNFNTGGTGFVFKRGKEKQGDDVIYKYDLLFVKYEQDGTDLTIKDYTIASAQCEQSEELVPELDEEIYSNLRDMLIETREYQILFNNLIPIKNMIASLSLYEFSALSDTAVYPEVSEAGINLADMLTKTKLSILQIFCASIYGNKEITYTDPFLEKAGTDLVS
jgi:hypothetical protein